jgi:MFS family permease
MIGARTENFRQLFSHLYVRKLFLALTLAKFSVGVLSFAVLLTVSQRYGNALGAGAVAAFSLAAAVGSPILGRLADRHGASRVITNSAIIHSAALAALAFSLSYSWQLTVVLAAVVGFTRPPTPAALAAVWRAKLTPQERSAAFSVVSALLDALYIVGPLLLAALTVGGHAELAIYFSALTTLVGSLLISHANEVKSLTINAEETRHWLGPLKSLPTVSFLLLVVLATAVLSFEQIGVLLLSQQRGEGSFFGIALAVSSVGAVIGGVGYGLFTYKRGAFHRTLWAAVLTLPFAVGLVPLTRAGQGALATGLLLGLFLLMELFLTPVFTAANDGIGDVVDEKYVNEAYTWSSTANQAGGAAALMGASLIGEAWGATGVFVGLALAVVLLILLSAASLLLRDKGPAQTNGATA